MAHATLGLTAPADAELARQPPGRRRRWPSPRRLHDRRRGRRAHRALRHNRRRPGRRPHHGHPARRKSRRLRGRHRPRRLDLRGRGHRQRRLCGGVRAGVRCRAATVDHVGDAARLPHPTVAAPRRRARRRGIGDRRPARRGGPRIGPPGHPGRRRTRPHATHVPRARHLLVDRDRRHPRRALRRGRRSRARPAPALTAADRHAAAALDRPQQPARRRRPDRRPARADPTAESPSSPAAWPTSVHSPTSSSTGSSGRSTTPPPTWGSATRSVRPSGSNRHAFPDRR